MVEIGSRSTGVAPLDLLDVVVVDGSAISLSSLVRTFVRRTRGHRQFVRQRQFWLADANTLLTHWMR